VDIGVNTGGNACPTGGYVKALITFRFRKSMQKARDRFPGAGSILGLNSWAQFLGSILALNSRDADNVPVICPTCQFFRALLST
jgi:hypothetical protein